ncbi:MAG: hypothetical protein EOP06_00510 [Proteobacteria bacterium]|nr:MAG: hypothetical protein EOP06_00510 [Pseudomonadota bacterium]
MERIDATDAVFLNINTADILGRVQSVSISFDIKQEDAGGVRDGWEHNVPVGAGWSLEADCTIADLPDMTDYILAGNYMVDVAFNSGAGIYTGKGVIKSASHSLDRMSLQKHKFSLSGHGPLVGS